MSEAVGALDALGEVLANGVLAWGLAACGVAQLSKLLIELVVHRRWRPAVLVETGGMPSSHSALMTGTAAGLGWELGFADPLFALAAVLCFVVLYDASGVRQAAGLTAERVNGLVADAGGLVGGHLPPRPLKQNLGHTRLQAQAQHGLAAEAAPAAAELHAALEVVVEHQIAEGLGAAGGRQRAGQRLARHPAHLAAFGAHAVPVGAAQLHHHPLRFLDHEEHRVAAARAGVHFQVGGGFEAEVGFEADPGARAGPAASRR
jgi:acid phosphatase family membrane protein YuiD